MNDKIECRDCDCRPRNNAVWYVLFTKYWRNNYDLPEKYPLCTECLIEILSDRFVGGGGYTSYDILKIESIDPENQRGYNYEKN